MTRHFCLPSCELSLGPNYQWLSRVSADYGYHIAFYHRTFNRQHQGLDWEQSTHARHVLHHMTALPQLAFKRISKQAGSRCFFGLPADVRKSWVGRRILETTETCTNVPSLGTSPACSNIAQTRNTHLVFVSVERIFRMQHTARAFSSVKSSIGTPSGSNLWYENGGYYKHVPIFLWEILVGTLVQCYYSPSALAPCAVFPQIMLVHMLNRLFQEGLFYAFNYNCIAGNVANFVSIFHSWGGTYFT